VIGALESSSFILKFFVVELRQPDGPPSGTPYSYWKENPTHELIFS